jgi:outer membrane protein OmpA-like peptidoglycan-associated protein
MKFILFNIFFLAIVQFSFAQSNLSGLWKGMIVKSGQSYDKADVFYILIEEKDGNITGRTRIELMDREEMAFKSFEGNLKNGLLSLVEDYVRNSSNSRKSPKCKLNYKLKYNDSTAYLEGTFTSSDCRNTSGNVVVFRSDETINKEKNIEGSHLWKKRFAENYEKGYPAPEILARERENFEFEPIYFDHDKSEIRPEHFDYLNEMARVLGGIHDLRVQVTGHTDAVGTDEYNIGLSERRAKAIKDYFKSRGIEPEKLEIEFKGESQPIDSNSTSQGKQRNRRVDFIFI